MKKKNILLGSVLSAAILALAACSNGDESVAIFDGGKVTKDALYEELVATSGENTLNIIVRDEITKKEAEKLKVTVTDKQLDEAVGELKAQYGSDEAFKEALKTYNVTEADVKEDMKADLLLENVLKKRIKVTDDEIKAYFEENKDSLAQSEQVQASHILVKTEKEATAILKELKDGADFAKLAKEKSTDTGSAVEGGDLGLFGKGEMTEAFEKAAFALKVGDISEPVESEYGYHIIKVTDKKEAKKATLEDNKETIKETLLKQKVQTEYTSWLDEKFKEYNVELKLK